MIKLLVLTHAHFDHAGSAAKLKELTGCKILVHRSEQECLRKGFATIPAGTRWKAKILSVLGRIFIPRIGKYPGAEPDILAGSSYDLKPHGFPGKVIHTPGHTHGSQVVLMDGGEMMAGDTLSGVPGKQHFPPFAEDLPALVQSWKKIRGLQIHVIYPAHGTRVPFTGFLAEYDSAMERYG
jgi:glyoxylase-like metal-dependent hydrolase (beta-lactamase superfamily II)